MSIPAVTTNTFTTTGLVKVVNGEVKIAGETTDRNYTATSGIYSAVFMKQTESSVTYGVYADLATALASAVSGNTIALRANATIVKDATVISGVTLDLKGFIIYVGDATLKSASTPTFTISGTINSSVAAVSDKCGVVAYTGSTVILNTSDTDVGSYFAGYVLFGATMTVSKDVTMTSTTSGIALVMGTLNVNGTVTSDVSLFNAIYATADFVNTEDVAVSAYTAVLNVAGEMTLKAGTVDAIDTLTVDVTGTLNLAGGVYTNNGIETITVESAGEVVPAAATTFENVGKLTMSVAGALAYNSVSTFAIINTGSVCNITVAGTLGVASITDTAANAVLTVSGTFTSAGGVSIKTLTVSGTGAFTSTGALTVTGTATVEDKAAVAVKADSTIAGLTVTGTATVIGVAPTTAADVPVITVTTLSVGTASSKLAASTNGATVTVTMDSANAAAYGIVYGTAANVKVTAGVSTNLYLVGTEANILYAVEYGVTSTTAKLVLDTLDITGYKMDGWFDSAVGTNTVSTSAKVGDYANVYATFTAKTYTVTFNYLAGAVYLVNGSQTASGQYTYAYGTDLTVSVIAASGYDASKATIQLNTTSPSTSAVTYTVDADATFTAAGVTEKTVSSSMSITDILLIILVVITAIVAIAVVLKLARS